MTTPPKLPSVGQPDQTSQSALLADAIVAIRQRLDPNEVARYLSDSSDIDPQWSMHPEYQLGHGCRSGNPGGTSPTLPDSSPSGITQFIAATVLLACHAPTSADASHLPLCAASIGYLKGLQRPSGRIDLVAVNLDGGPDTAFIIQRLAPSLVHLRTHCPSGWEGVRDALNELLRSTIPGMIEGGIHTPNHRWVTTCGLSQLIALFPAEAACLVPVRAAWRAETPDLDDEGFFIERSLAMYDPICIRALLLEDQLAAWPEGRSAAIACARRSLDLLNPNGSAETGLSHRQDAGSVEPPFKLAASLLLAGRVTGEATFTGAAWWVWEKSRKIDLNTAVWWAEELLAGAGGPLSWQPPAVDVVLPRNGLWRVRDADGCFTAFAHQDRLLSLHQGAVRIASMSIAYAYLGAGICRPTFIARLASGQVELRQKGWADGQPRGFRLPLGHSVGASGKEFTALTQERGLREVPPPDIGVFFERTDAGRGLAIAFKLAGALPGTLVQVAFDLPVGGELSTGELAFHPDSGQVLLLRAGSCRWRVGSDWLELAGGAKAHSTFVMRDTTPPPAGLVRLLIALKVPSDHTVQLTWGCGAGT